MRRRGPFTRVDQPWSAPFSPEEQRAAQVADVRSNLDKSRRLPAPCPVCLWPLAGWHPPHGGLE